jgi:hypothetical protein
MTLLDVIGIKMIDRIWQKIDPQKLANGFILALFIILVIADVLLVFYLLREANRPALIYKDDFRIYLPLIIRMPEQPLPTPESVMIATPAATLEIYIVKPGDTLSEIALLYGTTVDALAAANNIENVDLILIGQQLIIP